MKRSFMLLAVYSIVASCCAYVLLAEAACRFVRGEGKTFQVTVAPGKQNAVQIDVVSSELTNAKQTFFSGIKLEQNGDVVANFDEGPPKASTSFGIVKMMLRNVGQDDITVGRDNIAVTDASGKRVDYLASANFKGAMGVPASQDKFAYSVGISPGTIKKNEVKDFEILLTVPAAGSKSFTIQYKQEAAVKTN